MLMVCKSITHMHNASAARTWRSINVEAGLHHLLVLHRQLPRHERHVTQQSLNSSVGAWGLNEARQRGGGPKVDVVGGFDAQGSPRKHLDSVLGGSVRAGDGGKLWLVLLQLRIHSVHDLLRVAPAVVDNTRSAVLLCERCTATI